MSGVDLAGQTYGRWTVLERAPSVSGEQWRWLCQCACGVRKIVRSRGLRCGDSRSCGCLKRDAARLRTTKHGQTHTRLYKIWIGMRARCGNPTSSRYPDYGGRGIRVCPEWSEFQTFAAWARTAGYRDDLTIDRIDNDQGYSAENCRWATSTQQSRNKRTTRLSDEMVSEMRQLARAGRSGRSIAKQFDVSKSLVACVVAGQVWKQDAPQ